MFASAASGAESGDEAVVQSPLKEKEEEQVNEEHDPSELKVSKVGVTRDLASGDELISDSDEEDEEQEEEEEEKDKEEVESSDKVC